MDEKPKILIVDDEPVGRQLLEAILFSEGYNLLFAEDGEIALQKIIEYNPAIVLCDVMMPKIDGFEVCRRVRKDEKLAHIPILLITALDDRDSRIKGIDAGADDYISKPLDRIEILAKVRNRVILNKFRQKEVIPDKGNTVNLQESDNPLINLLINQFFSLNNQNINIFKSKETHKSKHAFYDFILNKGLLYVLISNKLGEADSGLANCLLKMMIQKELSKEIISPSEIIQSSLEKYLKAASGSDISKLIDTSYSIILVFNNFDTKEIIVSGLNQTLFVSQKNIETKSESILPLIPHYLLANQDLKLTQVNEIVLFSENMHELYPQPNLVSFLNLNIDNNRLKPLSDIIPDKFDLKDDILAVKLSF